MPNNFSFLRLRFARRTISDSRPCLLTLCLGLVLFQGCALLQRPPDIAAPGETPAPAAPKAPVGVPPAPSPTVKKKSRACDITTNRRSFMVWGATSRKTDGQRNHF